MALVLKVPCGQCRRLIPLERARVAVTHSLCEKCNEPRLVTSELWRKNHPHAQ